MDLDHLLKLVLAARDEAQATDGIGPQPAYETLTQYVDEQRFGIISNRTAGEMLRDLRDVMQLPKPPLTSTNSDSLGRFTSPYQFETTVEPATGKPSVYGETWTPEVGAPSHGSYRAPLEIKATLHDIDHALEVALKVDKMLVNAWAALVAARIDPERIAHWTECGTTDCGLLVDGIKACTVTMERAEGDDRDDRLFLEFKTTWHGEWERLAR